MFLELPKGIPSHDTFGRVFTKTKPEEFQKRFIEWVQAIEKLTAGQVIKEIPSRTPPTHTHPSHGRFYFRHVHF